jgi:hypothetical protein
MDTLISRDERGLPIIEGVEIPIKNGFVDWRGLINPEHLYINTDWFQYRKQEVPSSVEGLADHQLCIKLSGIKELARLRGFTSVRKNLTHVSPEHIVSGCQISWIGNQETNFEPVEYEDYASATVNNCDNFGLNFLETIACNRSFIRCVRNFLNIHIVGVDEFVPKNAPSSHSDTGSYIAVTPQITLEKALAGQGINSLEEFKEKLLRPMWKNKKYTNEKAADWNDFNDIPPRECLKLLALIKAST